MYKSFNAYTTLKFVLNNASTYSVQSEYIPKIYMCENLHPARVNVGATGGWFASDSD